MNFSGFSMFRKQELSLLPPAQPEQPATPPYSPKSPVRRKPLPRSATPIFSSSTQTPDQSPKQQKASPLNSVSQAPKIHVSPRAQFDFDSRGLGLIPLDLGSYNRSSEASPEIAEHPGTANPPPQQKAAPPQEQIAIQVQLPTPRIDTASPLNPSHARVASESHLVISQQRNQRSQSPRPASTATMSSSLVSSHHQNPSLHIPFRAHSPSNSEDDMNKPKSPSRLTSFFRWGSAAEQGGVQSLDWDHGTSHSLSPTSAALPPMPPKGTIPSAIDIPRANSLHSNAFHSDSGISLPPPTPTAIDEIEEEVRMISADLATSIRREMELEDLIERLQTEAAERTGGNAGKRTSDYFSDAGTPIRNLDGDNKLEYDAEKILRKAEQDKAQIRLEMVAKVQEERQRRKVVECHVRELEEQVARSGGNSQLLPADAAGRIKDLEVALDEARRRLAEERQMKENYEDLLSALKEQLEEHRNERDNLRDEVVPQLRARVEGLETEASELQKLMYEHSRMQQELANLKNENASLASALRTQNIRTKNRQSMPPQPYVPTSLGSSSPISITNNVIFPLNQKDRESLAEKLKDVEAQRDALHKALRSLRERQQYENKKSNERIKALEQERDKAMQQMPRKFGNDRELNALRLEVERLRQRADDVLEQKFMCERNLATLKMDLEQAEQETSTLRALLQEHDALVTQHAELKDSHVRLSKQVSQMKQELAEPRSLSLMQAYQDLQNIHERTLSRLDELEVKGTDLAANLSDRERRLSEAHENSQRAVSKLRKGIAEVEAERDTAQVEAEAYRKRAESLQKSEKMHLIEERNLATQLRISSERIEELVAQVKAQLESNNTLRDRLANAVDRGEEEQKMSAQRINELQGKLKQLEDKVLEAQQQTEDAIAHHEEEIRRLKESHNSQLRRLKISAMKSPTLFAPKSPLTPLLKSPKLEWATKHSSSSAAETSIERMEFLEKRVIELEKALSEADNDMADVVSKMTMSQVEVVDLHNQRDEAAKETRRLYAEVAELKTKFLSMSS